MRCINFVALIQTKFYLHIIMFTLENKCEEVCQQQDIFIFTVSAGNRKLNQQGIKMLPSFVEKWVAFVCLCLILRMKQRIWCLSGFGELTINNILSIFLRMRNDLAQNITQVDQEFFIFQSLLFMSLSPQHLLIIILPGHIFILVTCGHFHKYYQYKICFRYYVSN